ncbi:MAG TPA: hypothetical protein VLH79_09935 [Chthonomonadales bacterium]|nr:hypothetical protein [Chthonomonadales bacterium]
MLRSERIRCFRGFEDLVCSWSLHWIDSDAPIGASMAVRGASACGRAHRGALDHSLPAPLKTWLCGALRAADAC